MSQGLDALTAELTKKYGSNALFPATELRPPVRFPTGSLSLDLALGGGWPGNRWMEVIGMESSGKTTVVLKSIAACQAVDPNFTTLWVAAEDFDEEWATLLGVDIARVAIAPFRRMEVVYDVMLRAAELKAVDAIVLDSYPALIAAEEADKKMDENVMALGARLTGKFWRKAGDAGARAHDGSERPLLGIIINQWRQKVGAFSPHGTPKDSPGGWAKNFAYAVRLEVSRAEYIDEALPGGRGSQRVGQIIKCRTIKNKSAAPHRIASMDFYHTDTETLGFHAGEYDAAKELVTMGVLNEAIERRGAYFSVGDTRVHGKEALLDYLRGDLTAQQELTAAITKRALGGGH